MIVRIEPITASVVAVLLPNKDKSMSLWPVIRDLFIRKAAEEVIEAVIEEVVETAQEALSNRDKDKKESNKQSTKQKRPDKK